MKQTIHLLLSFCFIFISNEIEAQNKDQIIRINNVTNISNMNAITNPEKGCLVYVQSNGIYYYDGNNWVQNSNNSSSADWEMSGNSNATSSHFLGTTNNMDFMFGTDNAHRMIITKAGYIGIQTSDPQGIFHVNGGIIFDYSDDFIIGPCGKVGIGMFPNSYQLTVNGNILANAYNTPDYVFENYYSGKKSKLKTDYEFMPIEKVEAFVKVHHHLPGVPSQKDIENQGGILLNKSTEINLEKIEELFLHFFELNKKIESLKEEIEHLELHSQSKP